MREAGGPDVVAALEQLALLVLLTAGGRMTERGGSAGGDGRVSGPPLPVTDTDPYTGRKVAEHEQYRAPEGPLDLPGTMNVPSTDRVRALVQDRAALQAYLTEGWTLVWAMVQARPEGADQALMKSNERRREEAIAALGWCQRECPTLLLVLDQCVLQGAVTGAQRPLGGVSTVLTEGTSAPPAEAGDGYKPDSQHQIAF